MTSAQRRRHEWLVDIVKSPYFNRNAADAAGMSYSLSDLPPISCWSPGRTRYGHILRPAITMIRSWTSVNTIASRITLDSVTAIYASEKSIVDVTSRAARMPSISLAARASIIMKCPEYIDAFSDDCCTHA
jgi:hypothetical protein